MAASSTEPASPSSWPRRTAASSIWATSTTDPSIAENGFVSLEDTKKLFGSQNIVPLVSKDRADELAPALNAVSKALTTEVISGLLKQTVTDKKDAKDVAAEFLKANNLG